MASCLCTSFNRKKEEVVVTAKSGVIVKARWAHVAHLAKNLRQQDKDEVFAASHSSPYEAVAQSFLYSQKTPDCIWTYLYKGRPTLMWGAARKGSLLSTEGVPWLLGTNELTKIYQDVIRYSRPFVAQCLQEFTFLENYVHARNTVSIRWLKWCGFFIEPEPQYLGHLLEPFHRFELKRNVPVAAHL